MRTLLAKHWKLLVVLLTATWLAGCGTLYQYSIDSYDGPFPMGDRHYLEVGAP